MTQGPTTDNSRLQAALLYARLGWHVLPLHTMRGDRHHRRCSCGQDCGRNAGKHPLGSLVSHGAKDATTDEATIRRWWATVPDANVGIATGVRSGIWVVDVDIRHRGDETLLALERGHGNLPLAPHSLTGGGGDHYVFVCPKGQTIGNLKLAQGIDIRGDGGYVVAPPSVHQTGYEYAWEVSAHVEDLRAPQAPAWLLELIGERTVAETVDVEATVAGGEFAEPPVRLPAWGLALWNGERVVDAADGEEKPADEVSDVDRSETLFAIGRALKGAGASASTIAAALADRDRMLGYDKYTGRSNGHASKEYGRIAAKVLAEYRPVGAPRLVTRTTTEPAEEAEGEYEEAGYKAHTPQERWQAVPASQLNPNGEAVDWIWEGYLARGAVTELVGLWKAGKTTLLAHLIHTMERGGMFAGMTVSKSRVLVVTEEHSSLWIERRDEFGFSDHVHFICRPFLGKPNLTVWRQFCAYCGDLVAHNEYDAMFLDPFATLTPIEDENDAGEVTTAIVEFHRITEAGAGLLVPHHPNKIQSGQGMSSRGSGALPGFVDILLEFGRYDTARLEDKRRVIKGLSRFKETPQEVVIELTDGGYVMAGTKAETRHSDRAEVILSLLSKISVTAEAIRLSWPEGAAAAQPSTKTIMRDLATLIETGTAIETGSGTRGDPRLYALK